MSSPKGRRKNATVLLSTPNSMNPFLSFLHTTKLSTIQRSMQSRRLFQKINKVNAVISDKKIKWTTADHISELKGSKEKFLMLINKHQAPLQINSRIRMRKTMENMRKNENDSPLDRMKSQKLLISPREFEAKASASNNDKSFEDLKSIKKSIKQISQISRYFDRVYKIDKKQKYLKIDTLSYWQKIDTTPGKKKELIDLYNKVHKDEKFTFSEYQREYEEKWLEILKNLKEKDKASILFLINGGHHEDDIEEQIKTFDPSKIIQKMEYKRFLEEKKQKEEESRQNVIAKSLFVPPQAKSVKNIQSMTENFTSQREPSTSNSKRMPTFFRSETKSKTTETPVDKPKEKTTQVERTQLNSIKAQTCTSFDQIPEGNSPSKSLRSQAVLKNFLYENLPLSTDNIKSPAAKKVKAVIETEKMRIYPPKDQVVPSLKSLSKTKHINFSNSSTGVQECFCKHVHNIQCYQLKKDHKSIFKIPSVLPPTRKTFMEIRRASHMPFEEDQNAPNSKKLNINMIQTLMSQKEREGIFLEQLKSNINESYENRESSPLKNNFILENYGYKPIEEISANKSRSFFSKHLDPMQEEIKRCENILQKKTFTSNFSKSYKDLVEQRKERLTKKVKNLLFNKKNKI